MGASESSEFSLSQKAAMSKAKAMLGDSMFALAKEKFRSLAQPSHKSLAVPAKTLAAEIGISEKETLEAFPHIYKCFLIPNKHVKEDLPEAIFLSLVACISNGTTLERAQLYLCFFEEHSNNDTDLTHAGILQKEGFIATLNKFVKVLADKHKNLNLTNEFSESLASRIFENDSSLSVAMFSRQGHIHPFLSVMDNVFKSFIIHPSGADSLTPFIVTSALDSKLLSFEAVSTLNELLPVDCRGNWNLVYSDSEDGASFAKFRSEVEAAGLCVIVVRDSDGYIFGGFGSEAWHMQPLFFGSDTSFLFTVKPNLRIYESSGFNDNFQYLNTGTQSLPNGLGFGGQMNFFGLFIESDFQHGHCKGAPSSTFKNPRLSKEEIFTIDKVEVWKVAKETGEEKVWGDASILNNRAQENSLLELAGKTMHSKHIRYADKKDKEEKEKNEAMEKEKAEEED